MIEKCWEWYKNVGKECIVWENRVENFVAKVEKDYSRFENEASPVREQFLIPIIEIIGPRSDC